MFGMTGYRERMLSGFAIYQSDLPFFMQPGFGAHRF
jgi:hypothetical protein